MITGIQLDVSEVEMRAHLTKQIAHHDEKEKFYAESATKLHEGGLDATGHSRDPLADIKSKSKEHRNKREFLSFVREHLVTGETYRLSVGDLATLGFVSERHY